MDVTTIGDNNSYIPAAPGDSRSPCPALNALANHGYLGRNVTASQLITAVERQYKLDAAFTRLLVYGGLLKCGHWDGLSLKLDLHDLAKHNVIEHDGSLVHDDTAPGETFAPTGVDPALVQQLLNTGSDSDILTLHDLCKAQVVSQVASRPLGTLPAVISKGELDLIYQVFGVVRDPTEANQQTEGSEIVVPKSYLKQWLGQERLPDGWTGPLNAVAFSSLSSHIKMISGIEKEIKLESQTNTESTFSSR